MVDVGSGFRGKIGRLKSGIQSSSGFNGAVAGDHVVDIREDGAFETDSGRWEAKHGIGCQDGQGVFRGMS